MKHIMLRVLALAGCVILLLCAGGCEAEWEKTQTDSQEDIDAADVAQAEIQEPAVPLQSQPETEQQLCDRYEAWFYARGEVLLEQFDQLKAEALEQANQKSSEEWDEGYLAGIAIEFLWDSYDLLSECDADVEAKLEEMERDLDAIGGNQELVQIFADAYRAERQKAVAAFMQQFKTLT